MSQANIWMHIGAGSFHRAHQAVYLNNLRQTGDLSWEIALGNIRDDASALLNTLVAQNGEYVLETVSPEGERRYETISSVRKILAWDPSLKALSDQGADPQTKVISFTVTEGGYYLDTDHNLDPSYPDIQADLNGDARTIYGCLVRILQARKQANAGTVTLLCCDNVRHNGDLFRKGFLEFLHLKGDQDLLTWVEKNTASPNTMVDRITPRPTADIAPRVKAATGKDDKAALMGEAFIQWVIEDRFINGRPALEKVGVEMVSDVQPWEEAKIRILNATHSCIAWAGTLTGLLYIDDSTRVEAIAKLAFDYVTQDVIPDLSPSPLNLEDYRDVVLNRFSNPYIKDTNQRVAADGLSKIPGFITPTLIGTYKRGGRPQATAVLPALYFIFMHAWHNNSLPYEYQDGVLDAAQMHAMFESADPIAQFSHNETLFGDLVHNDDFHALMKETVARMQEWIAANQSSAA